VVLACPEDAEPTILEDGRTIVFKPRMGSPQTPEQPRAPVDMPGQPGLPPAGPTHPPGGGGAFTGLGHGAWPPGGAPGQFDQPGAFSASGQQPSEPFEFDPADLAALDFLHQYMCDLACSAKSNRSQCQELVRQVEPLKRHIAAGSPDVRAAASVAVCGTYGVLAASQERDYPVRQMHAGELFGQAFAQARVQVERAHQAAGTGAADVHEAEPAETRRAAAIARAFIEDLAELRARSPLSVIALPVDDAANVLEKTKLVPDEPPTALPVPEAVEDAGRPEPLFFDIVQMAQDAKRVSSREALAPPPEAQTGVGLRVVDPPADVHVVLCRGTYMQKDVHVALVRGNAATGAGVHQLAYQRCPGSVAPLRACKLSAKRSKIVMDCARGTLQEVLAQHEGFAADVGQRLVVAMQLVDAVANLHALKIYLRGLSCDTVLVYDDDAEAAAGGLRAKVADFSVVKVTHSSSILSVSGSYAASELEPRREASSRAPEARSGRPSDPAGLAAMDVFSLAHVARTLAVGNPDGDGTVPVDLSGVSLDPAVAEELQRVLQACLAKDAAARPGIADLRAGLARCYEGLTGQPAPPRRTERGMPVAVAVPTATAAEPEEEKD